MEVNSAMRKISKEVFDLHYCSGLAHKGCNHGPCRHASPEGCTHPMHPSNQSIPRKRYNVFSGGFLCVALAMNEQHALKIARQHGLRLEKNAFAVREQTKEVNSYGIPFRSGV
jgi:hypothetical protein